MTDTNHIYQLVGARASAWVVASSKPDAVEVWQSARDDSPTVAVEQDDSTPLTLAAPDGLSITRTCAEWAKVHGRGVLRWKAAS